MAITLLEQRQIEANVLFRFRLKQEREDKGNRQV